MKTADYYSGISSKKDIISIYSKEENFETRVKSHIKFTYPPRDTAKFLLRFINLKGDENLLDVGCGSGHFLLEFANHLPQSKLICGIDLSLNILRYIKRKKLANGESISLICGDVERLPLKKERIFDIILCNYVLQYIEKPKLLLKHLYEILTDGGVIIITTHHASTMRKEMEIFERALSNLGYQIPKIIRKRVNCENVEKLISSFSFQNIQTINDNTLLIFPTIDDFLSYFNTIRWTKEKLLPNYITWDDAMKQVEATCYSYTNSKGELILERKECHFFIKK